MILIRRLGVEAVLDYRRIRLEALQRAPDAFGATFADEQARPISAFAERLTGSLVLAAEIDGDTVGMAGLRQETGPRDRHKACLWGVYVRPEARRLGVGNALTAGAIEAARDLVEQIVLTVVDSNAAARLLYERHGFTTYGIAPRSLKGQAGYLDERLMVRFL